jgi:ACT domain-containing protein
MPRKKQPQIWIMTVTGADKVGIIATLAATMARANINILDVNQKIMEHYFVMTMAVDIADAAIPMDKFKKRLDKIARDMALSITFQSENIFKAMHRV